MTKYITYSDKETKLLAQKLAGKINKGVIALFGELGAGKTTFIQGFAKGLQIKEKIISPTFVLIRQHQIPNSDKILYHIDLYRLDSGDDLKAIGLLEVLSDPQNKVLIEWAEKAEKYLPKNAIKISIEKVSENKRNITIS